ETTRGRGRKGRALRSRGHAARLLFLSRHVRARRRGPRGRRKVSQAGRRSLTAPKGEPAVERGWRGRAFSLGAAGLEAGGVGGGGRATRQPGQVRKEAALTSAVRVARQPPTLPPCEARRPALRRRSGWHYERRHQAVRAGSRPRRSVVGRFVLPRARTQVSPRDLR